MTAPSTAFSTGSPCTGSCSTIWSCWRARRFVLAFFGVVPHDPTAMAFTGVLIFVVCWVTNWLFACVYGVPANNESVYITALILMLIMDPVTAETAAHRCGGLRLGLGDGLEIHLRRRSQAHLQPRRLRRRRLGAASQPARHLVGRRQPGDAAVRARGRPAAGAQAAPLRSRGVFLVAALATMLVPADPANYGMVAVADVPLVAALVLRLRHADRTADRADDAHWLRLVFAALVGFLCAPDIHVGSFYLTPELAILVGNLFA